MNSDTCLSYFDKSVYKVQLQQRQPIQAISTIISQKKRKKTKAIIKLHDFLHDYYLQQINAIPRRKGNFSAWFKLVNKADYTYFQEKFTLSNDHRQFKNLLSNPKSENNITNRMRDLQFSKL